MKEESSFRDPSGYIFYEKGEVYRAITGRYQSHYDQLMSSGLHDELVKKGMMVDAREIEFDSEKNPDIYRIIKPQIIPLISYPYEWSFSELKDAALLTLDIQVAAISKGMTLKDASAYNIQFLHGKPIFIDTLSFETYEEGKSWIAYKQFCQHFLAPLALMSYRDVQLGRMMTNYIDGIPLDLCCRLLPFSARFNVGLMLHLYFHAYAQTKYKDNKVKLSKMKMQMSKKSLLDLINGLRIAVRRLNWKPQGTEWVDYTDEGVHKEEYLNSKRQIIAELVVKANPHTVWDLGGNTGNFSRIAAKAASASVVTFDVDPACVEKNYLKTKTDKEEDIFPLFLDLANPAPAIGWAGEERKSLAQRGPADLVMALAIIHHLCIANNVPFDRLASYFSRLGKKLIIEFVPKGDPKVQFLLTNRPDIFTNYNKESFEKQFSEYFIIDEVRTLEDSDRILYLMTRKGNE